jgi:hypothetical protein
MSKLKVKRYEGTISTDLFNDIQVLKLSHIDENVSEANSIPWTKWIPENCLLQGVKGSIQHFNSSNCHYILYKNYVVCAFGFHGFNVFDDLVKDKDKKIKRLADNQRAITKALNDLDIAFVKSKK